MYVELALISLLGAFGAGLVVYVFLGKRQQALLRRSEEQRGMERREERLAMREEQSQWLAAHEKERLEFERAISRQRQSIELEAKRVESLEKAL